MKNAEYGLTENLIFKEAVAFLKKKKTLTEDEYKLLDEESRAKAFTVSGYTSMDERLPAAQWLHWLKSF